MQGQKFLQTGGNKLLSISPSILHFHLGVKHILTFRIINKSGSVQRMDILPPTTPFFRMICHKTGGVAPGMHEEVRVEVMPDAWRYYYDEIRIHCPDVNLVVPLHAYPVMNALVFPRQVEFGKCPIGQRHTKNIPISSEVPVAFEFQLTPLDQPPEFTIGPLSGTIPPGGAQQIAITYEPMRFVTSTLRVRVDISQFGFEPLICTVTGSALPGKARETLLAQARFSASLERTAQERAIQADMLAAAVGGSTASSLPRSLAQSHALRSFHRAPLREQVGPGPTDDAPCRDRVSEAEALQRKLRGTQPL
eukprot:gnl/Trimastix_PCT/4620.p1 GENE.gnl/Trimastix_PCT/4620~~gnl/Trimastix_PCT/4620.p1  ORF type:complete len:307 (-),score=67.01 gnl/Trimastix_PCT/4620:38-958(-)